MTTTELLALFRTEVDDLEPTYLWSDAQIYGYIDAAQRQFCRDTYGVADARSFSISVLANGTEWYDIDPRILKIRLATRADNGKVIPLIAFEKMPSMRMSFDGVVGEIKAFITGMEDNVLRAWPKPNVAATINLGTFRLPATVEAYDDLEIGEQHHRDLLHWVRHLAYAVPDSETFNKNASEEFYKRHKAYCAQALVEQSRSMHTAECVSYGGL